METGFSLADRQTLAVPETVPIPAGRLDLLEAGASLRTVEIPSFRIGRMPVVNREYAPFLAAGLAPAPPWWSDPDFSLPGQPVVGVTWDDAAAFCDWLSASVGGRWRLPTEEEWELAASGGLLRPRTAWGEAIPPGEIPEGPIAGPWEAGRGAPNGYGVCDAGTIVHEWCGNWREQDPAVPTPPAGSLRRRASRGGSWRHAVRWSSPSARTSLPPGFRYSDYGFRVLQELRIAR